MKLLDYQWIISFNTKYWRTAWKVSYYSPDSRPMLCIYIVFYVMTNADGKLERQFLYCLKKLTKYWNVCNGSVSSNRVI